MQHISHRILKDVFLREDACVFVIADGTVFGVGLSAAVFGWC